MTSSEVTQVAITYNDLRRALMALDYMDIPTRAALGARVLEAAIKYDDAPDTPAQNAENKVLVAFAEYIQATIREDFRDGAAA